MPPGLQSGHQLEAPPTSPGCDMREAAVEKAKFGRPVQPPGASVSTSVRMRQERSLSLGAGPVVPGALPAEYLAQCLARGKWRRLLPAPLVGTAVGTTWAPCGLIFPARCQAPDQDLMPSAQGLEGEPIQVGPPSIPPPAPTRAPAMSQWKILEVLQGWARTRSWHHRAAPVKNIPCNYRPRKLLCRNRAGHCAGEEQGWSGKTSKGGASENSIQSCY